MGEKTSFEFLEWSLNTNSLRARLSIIYRPPYSNLHPVSLKTFFDDFASYMESIITPEPLIITGDFNIHVNNTNDSDACKFLDLLASLGLKQHVIGPIHEGGHTLDLVITRQYDQVPFVLGSVSHFLPLLPPPPRRCWFLSTDVFQCDGCLFLSFGVGDHDWVALLCQSWGQIISIY